MATNAWLLGQTVKGVLFFHGLLNIRVAAQTFGVGHALAGVMAFEAVAMFQILVSFHQWARTEELVDDTFANLFALLAFVGFVVRLRPRESRPCREQHQQQATGQASKAVNHKRSSAGARSRTGVS